jgi:hypothetical protein
MGAQSRLIAVAHFSDLKEEWLDYPIDYYNINRKKEDIIYCELINCNTTHKSRDLLECFSAKGFSDFQNHLIRTKKSINWDNVARFDFAYEDAKLKEKLDALVGTNNIVIFVPNF